MTRVFPTDTLETRSQLPVARPQCATPGCKGRPTYTDAWGSLVCGPCLRADRGLRVADGALHEPDEDSSPAQLPPTPAEEAPVARAPSPPASPSAPPSPSRAPRSCRWPGCDSGKLLAHGFCTRDHDRVRTLGLNHRQVGVEGGTALEELGTLWEARVARVREERRERVPRRPVASPSSAPVVKAAPPASVEKVTEPLPEPAVAHVQVEALRLADCRPEVLAFALAMERKLRVNDAKKGPQGWKDHDPRALLRRVSEEAAEVHGALNARDFGRADGDDDAILNECADVANMAMMVADAAGVLPVCVAEPVTILDRGHVRDCAGAQPGSGYAAETRLRAERDRLRAEVVALRGHVAHDLVADAVNTSPSGKTVFRCARPGCDFADPAPVHPYFDGGCVVARVPDPREARIAELEASLGLWQRTVLGVMGVCDAYRLDNESPVVQRVEHLLDRARAADVAEGRVADLEAERNLERARAVALENQLKATEGDETGDDAFRELAEIREALGLSADVDGSEVIAEIERMRHRSQRLVEVELRLGRLWQQIASVADCSMVGTTDKDLVEAVRKLSSAPRPAPQETITIRVECQVADVDDRAPVPADVQRERIVFGALCEVVEAIYALVPSGSADRAHAAAMRALRALGGLEVPRT